MPEQRVKGWSHVCILADTIGETGIPGTAGKCIIVSAEQAGSWNKISDCSRHRHAHRL
jgi:hypothetical protein